MSDVALRFAATDDGLTAQFRKVNRQLDDFEKASQRVTGELGAFSKAVAGAFSATAIAGFARTVFESADAISDAAKRAGIGADSFSRLAYSLNLGDASFEALTTSARKFQVVISEATLGSAGATKALADLELSASSFTGLRFEQQLAVVADQFAKVQDPADRTRIAVDLFGRSGTELIPVLQQGSKGLREMADEADRFGVTLKTSAAEGIDVLDGALKRLSAVTLGAARNNLGTLALDLLGPDEGNPLSVAAARIRELEQARDRLSVGGSITGFIDQEALQQVNRDLEVARDRLTEIQRIQAEGSASGGPRSRNPLVPIRDLTDAKIPRAGRPLPVELTPEQRRAQADAASPVQPDFTADLAALEESFSLTEAANQAHLDELIRQQGEYQTFSVDNQTAFGGAMAAIREQYGLQEIDFESFKAASLGEIGASLGSSLLTIGTSLFGQNKKIAIASATISVADAMAKALDLPFPANLAAVAKVAAQGAQIISTIRSTSIGGSGSLSGGGGIGGSAGESRTPGVDNRPIPTGASERAATQVFITGYIGDKQVREMIDALRSEMDRDVVIIPSSSRQAIELRGD